MTRAFNRDESPPRRRGRLIVPLLASAALHVIVCAALPRIAPRPAVSTPRPFEIELVEVPAPVGEGHSAPRSSSPAGHGGDSRPRPSAGAPPRAPPGPAPALRGA